MSNKTIQHKRSSVAGNTPSTAQVAVGELAINFADKSIYTQDGSGNIIELERDIYKSADAPSSPDSGDVWYNKDSDNYNFWNGSNWIPLIYNGKTVDPSNTTSQVGFSGGSGTDGDEYTYSTNIQTSPGAIGVYVDTITVSGLTPGSFVELKDNAASTNGGRFKFSNNVVGDDGNLVFTVLFDDVPASTVGTNYTGSVTIGSATTYVFAGVEIASNASMQSINSPTNTLSRSTSWSDPDDTLTSTGCLLISNDNTSFVQTSTSITTSGTLYLKWKDGPGTGTCIDDSHGDTITGTVVNSAGQVSNHSLVIDKTPVAFTFNDLTGVAKSDSQTSNTITVSGINSYGYLTTPDSNGILVSINGAAFDSIPASGTSLYVVNGDTIQLKHTSSALDSTQVNSLLNVGGASDTFTTETTGASASVATPSITAPTSSATGIAPYPVLQSSAYTPENGAAGHQDTDWEIYSDAGLSTLVWSSSADTTNLVEINTETQGTWAVGSSLGYATTYYVRVRHRSSDPVASSFSSAVEFTTKGNPLCDGSPTILSHTDWITSNGVGSANKTAIVWKSDGSGAFVKVSGGQLIMSNADGSAIEFEKRIKVKNGDTVSGGAFAGQEFPNYFNTDNKIALSWNESTDVILIAFEAITLDAVSGNYIESGPIILKGKRDGTTKFDVSFYYNIIGSSGWNDTTFVDRNDVTAMRWDVEGGTQTHVAAGYAGKQIQTTDDGVTWSQSTNGQGFVLNSGNGVGVNQFAKDPITGNYWYPMQSFIKRAPSSNGPTHNPANYVDVTPGFGSNWQQVAAYNGNIIVSALGAADALAISTDNGSNWTNRHSEFVAAAGNDPVSVAYHSPTNAFFASRSGLWYSTDAGATWNNCGSGGNPKDLYYDVNTDTIYGWQGKTDQRTYSG